MAKAIDCSFLLTIPHVEPFLKYYGRDKTSRTIRNHELRLASFFEYLSKEYKGNFSDIDVTRFTRLHNNGRIVEELPVQQHVVREFLEGISPLRRRESTRVTLRQFFHFLLQQRKLDRNPVRKTPYYRHRYTPKQAPTPDTLFRFVEYVQREVRQPYRGAMMLQFSTGLRISALLKLPRNSIEHEDGHWQLRVPASIQKNKQESLKPLPNILLTIRAYLNWRKTLTTASDLLFLQQDGSPITVAIYNQELDRISTEIGTESPLRSHDLRRGIATLLSNFVDVDAIRQFLDHVDSNITGRYIRMPTARELRADTGRLPSVKAVDSFFATWTPPEQ